MRAANPGLVKKIKSITIKEISRSGVESISMRNIARLAEITPTTIYYYFRDKMALFESIKKDAFEKLNDFVLSRINPGDSFSKQTESLVRAFTIWLIDNRRISELIFDKLPPNIKANEETMAHYYILSNKVLEIINQGRETGEFKFDDAEVEANVGLGMIFGIVKLHFNKRLSPRFWDDIEPLVERMTQIILNSLK